MIACHPVRHSGGGTGTSRIILGKGGCYVVSERGDSCHTRVPPSTTLPPPTIKQARKFPAGGEVYGRGASWPQTYLRGFLNLLQMLVDYITVHVTVTVYVANAGPAWDRK